MIWFMEILCIEIEEQLLIKYYVIKNLISLKIQNMMDIKLALMIYRFFDKKTFGSGIKKCSIKNWWKNYANQLSEHLMKKSTFTFYL